MVTLKAETEWPLPVEVFLLSAPIQLIYFTDIYTLKVVILKISFLVDW